MSFVPVSCSGGTDGRITINFTPITETGTHFFRLFTQAGSPVGAAINISSLMNSVTFSGSISEGTYQVRYFRFGGSGGNCGVPTPVVMSGTDVIMTQPTFPEISFSQSEICDGQDNFFFGTDPIPPRGQAYSSSWVFSAPMATLTGNPNFTDQFVLVSGFPVGSNTAYWTVSVSGCGAVTSSGFNFTVSGLPTITSTLSSNVCSGSTFNYTSTSNIIGSTFEWSRALVPGISNSAVLNNPSAFISESLVNTTSLPINVLYQITPTGPTALQCGGITSVLTVTVFPAPVASYSGNTTLCSGFATNLSITSSINPGTNFIWSINGLSGSVSGQVGGSGSLIVQTLTGSGSFNYVITPIVGATSCPGTPLFIPITINPLPSITGITAPSICSGTPTNISWSVSPSLPATFNWSATYQSGLTGVSSGSGNPISISITNSSSNTLTGTFSIIPTILGTGCVGRVSTVTQTVFPLPLLTSSLPGSICSGNIFSRTLTATIPVSNYLIIRQANGNVVETATSQTFVGTTINHTLTSSSGNQETVVYTVVPISSTNCTGSGTSFNVTVNPLPTLTGTNNFTICSGLTPSISLFTNPSGSVYTWTRTFSGVVGSTNQATTVMGFTSAPLTGNGNVTYSIFPNLSGCIGNARNYNVQVLPVLTVTSFTPTICGFTTAMASVTTNGSSITWFNGSTATSVSTIPSAIGLNSYPVTISSGFCSIVTSAGIFVQNIPTVLGVNQTVCGLTSVSNTLNTNATNFSWSNGQTTNPAILTPLSFGINNFTATVSSGICSVVTTVSVLSQNPITVSGSTITICGISPQSVAITTNGTVFNWSNGQSTNPATLTPVSVGLNTFSVTVSSGVCQVITTVGIFVNAPITFNSNIPTVCGLSSGTMNITTNGLNIQWYNGSIATSLTTTPGTFGLNLYSLTITSGVCILPTIAGIVALPTLTVTSTNSTVCGLSSVSNLLQTNGTSFNWSNGQTTNPATLTPTSTGINMFSVTISAGNCSVVTTVGVFSQGSITVAGTNQTVCGISSISVNVTTNGTSFSWNTGQTTNPISVSPIIGNNIYTLTVTSGICQAIQSVTVTSTIIPTVSGNNVTVCGLTPANITVSGNGTAYNWSNGATGTSIMATPTILGTNNFIVTVSSSICQSVSNFSVIALGSPTLTGSNSTTICSGIGTILTATGAASISWNPGASSGTSFFVNPSSTTTYTVSGLSGSCVSNNLFITVTVNSNPSLSVSGNNTICQGNSTTLTGSGASSYLWQPGSLSSAAIVVSPSVSTNYTLTGILGSCSSTSIYGVIVNVSTPSPPVSSPVNYCVGQIASPLATSGPATSPLWYTTSVGGVGIASITPSTSVTGTQFYYVTQTIAACESPRAQIQVNVLPSPTIIGISSYSTCSGSTFTMSISGASSYSWFPNTGLNTTTGTLVMANLSASQNYTVTGTTGACTATRLISVTINPIPSVSILASSTVCSGFGGIQATATGANTYQWQPGSLSGNIVLLNPGVTTTYSITGTSASGCVSPLTLYTLSVNPAVGTPSPISGLNSFCGGSFGTTIYSSSATNATGYLWGISNAGTSTIDNAGNVSWDGTFIGIASITVSALGCGGPLLATHNVTVLGTPTVTGVAGNDPSSCTSNDGTMTISGIGMGSLSFFNGFTTNTTGVFTNLSPTNYSAQITDANGCVANGTSVTLSATGQPDAPIISGDITHCENSSTVDLVSVSTTATGVLGLYSGLPISSATLITTTSLANFDYQVTTTPGTYQFYANVSVTGCVSAIGGPVTVIINQAPTAPGVTSPVTVCQNAVIVHPLVSTATNPTWYDSLNNNLGSSTNPDVTNFGTFNYFVTETDANGCESINRSTVVVSVTSSAIFPCSCNATYTMQARYDGVVCHNQVKEYVEHINLTGTAPFTVFIYDPSIAADRTFSGINSTSFIASVTGFNITSSSIYHLYSISGIYDNDGCLATQQLDNEFAFTHYPAPTIIGINQPNAVCEGNSIDITTRSQGEIPALPGILQSYHSTFGDADKEFPTNNLSNSNTISVSGTYYYRYEADPFGTGQSCWAIAPINVTINPLPQANITGTQTICGGNSTFFVVNLTTGNASPNWSFVYNDGVTPSTLSGINSNPFNFNVTPGTTTSYNLISLIDGNGCTNTASGTATITVLPAASAICSCTSTARFVPGGNIGSHCEGSPTSYNLAVSVSGFNVNGIELFQNGANPLTFTGLVPDVNNFVLLPVNPSATTTYSIGQVFSSSCAGIGSGTAVVNVNPSPSLVGSNLINAICGQLSVDITTVLSDIHSVSGTNTFWTDAATTISLANPNNVTVAGVYYHKIESSSGCIDIQPIQVVFPTTPVAIISGNQSVCGGNPASIGFSASGGSGNYQITFTNGTGSNTFTFTGTFTSTTVSPLINTNYSITGFNDLNGCVGTFSGLASVSILPSISCSGCTPPSATNLSLSQVSTSGLNATWINAPSANYYQFDLATDNLFTNPVSGAFGITTTGLNFSVSGLSTGVYFARVFAINSCGTTSGLNTITITNNTLNTTILGSQNIPSGTAAVLTVILSGTGPFSNVILDYGYGNSFYSSQSSNIFTITVYPAITTTYSITAYTDANGQSQVVPAISATVNVITPVAPSVQISAPFITSCSTGSFIFDAIASGLGGGTANYTWLVNGSVTGQSINSPNVTFTGLQNGDNVSVVISVTGGIVTVTTATSNIVQTQINNSIATLSYLPVSCIGGEDGAIIININAQNSGRLFNYFVNSITGTVSGSGQINNVSAAAFVLTIQDNFNPSCFQILTGNTGLADFQVIKSGINPSCVGNDGSIRVAVVSQVHSNYNVTIKGINLADTVIVFNNLTTTSSLSSVINYTATKLEYGIYSTQFGYGNCVSAEFIDTLQGAQPPVADLGLDSMNVCEGQQFTLSTPGISGGSFRWFRNDTLIGEIPSNSITLVASKSAKFTVQVPGNNGCVASDVIKVNTSNIRLKTVSTLYTNEKDIQLKWHLSSIPSFPSDSLFIFRRDMNPELGIWQKVGSSSKNDSVYINSSLTTNEKVFQYRVQSSSNSACVSDLNSSIRLTGTNDENAQSVTLAWNSYKTWSAGVKEYQIWRKMDEEAQYQYLQTSVDTNLILQNVVEGKVLSYRILAISNTPFDTDSIVSWSNTISVTFRREVVAYNAFSPNGDGVNETFVVKNIMSYPNNEIFIFNRWGGRVHYAKPYANNWTGEGSPDGTYFYVLDLGDGSPTIKGSVLLQR
jgi:gliding motility-associated-like protein